MTYFLGGMAITLYGLMCFYLGFREGFGAAIKEVVKLINIHMPDDAKQELPEG